MALETTASALVDMIEAAMAEKGPQAKPVLDRVRKQLQPMRDLAIDLHFQIERLEKRVAHHERDARETWRTIRMLQEAGLFDEDQFSAANNIVTDARGPNNTFTDVDTILKRNREEMNNETSN